MRISDWSSDVCSSDLLRIRRLDRTVTLRRQPEFLQRLAPDLHHDRLGLRNEADGSGPFQITAIGVLEILLLERQLVLPEAAVLDVALELNRVGRPLSLIRAVGAAPAGQRADARLALGLDDAVGIPAGVARLPVLRRGGRRAEAKEAAHSR